MPSTKVPESEELSDQFHQDVEDLIGPSVGAINLDRIFSPITEGRAAAITDDASDWLEARLTELREQRQGLIDLLPSVSSLIEGRCIERHISALESRLASVLEALPLETRLSFLEPS